MNFDFHKEYAPYSNVALLKIMLLKDQYQPEAIVVVQNLLNTRTITEAERQQAHDLVFPPVKRAIPEIQQDLWQPGDDLFEVKNELAEDPLLRRRLRIILIILGLIIVQNAYRQLGELINEPDHLIAGSMIDVCMNTILLVLQVISSLFLWKGQKRGWMLTIGWICYLFLTNVISLVALVYYDFAALAVKVIAQMGMLAGCTALLLSEGLRRAFGIDRPLMVRTLVISITVSVAYSILVFFYAFFILGGRSIPFN